jgi:ABC-type polysaccharide/polyol phosphate transport system ATPase subunit
MRARFGGKPLDWQWALRDITLDLEPGDAVGLVGNNGSGKSTLLKILGRVMYPYAGSVHVAGRIGALIEVRAGIQPDLTGRENIAVYGTLLGLNRREVQSRFDAIVDFAELEFAVDRQVKFYSSGMQVRLGFAVAAYLEPDVLLVDEVLAVGDASFQQRCLERMRVVLNQGTTLIFVSHDLASVQAVSNRGMWLNQGVVVAEGPVNDVLSAYRAGIEETAEALEATTHGPLRKVAVEIDNPDGAGPLTQQPLDIHLRFECESNVVARLYLGISEGTADPIFVSRFRASLHHGVTEARCSMPRLPLPKGRYFVWLLAQDDRSYTEFLGWQPIGSFDVFGPNLDDVPKGVVRRAPIHIDVDWTASVLEGANAIERPKSESEEAGLRTLRAAKPSANGHRDPSEGQAVQPRTS